jgi:hypothetical protein
MISVSKTIPVNPAGADVTLTREDVWRGLEAKANNALPFVPSMTRCDVLSRTDNVIEREIEFRGERLGERVTLDEPRGVTFERTSGPVMGTIHNDILEERPGELELRFSFDLIPDGIAAGSAEEDAYRATMEQDYLKAVDATLAAIRRWTREGTPAVT